MGATLDQIAHHMGDPVTLFIALVLGALALSGKFSVSATKALLFMAWIVALIAIREQSWATIGWVGGILGFTLILLANYFRPPDGRAKLTISGPHKFEDKKYRNLTRWRMRVHNAGPATAANVQIKLLDGRPGPRDQNWRGDFPYPVYQVDTIKNSPEHIRLTGRTINKDDAENYEISCCWKAEEGDQLYTDINTKGGGHNNIQIQPDERWRFHYVVTAENSQPIRFSLAFFVINGEVVIDRGRSLSHDR